MEWATCRTRERDAATYLQCVACNIKYGLHNETCILYFDNRRAWQRQRRARLACLASLCAGAGKGGPACRSRGRPSRAPVGRGGLLPRIDSRIEGGASSRVCHLTRQLSRVRWEIKRVYRGWLASAGRPETSRACSASRLRKSPQNSPQMSCVVRASFARFRLDPYSTPRASPAVSI